MSPTTPRPRSSPWDPWSRCSTSVRAAQVDLGFVPLENAIEGTVRDIIDSLVFEFDLRIQREVVLDIHLHLMARPGTELAEIERVASIPMATAQCRRFLTAQLPAAELVATNSTAEAARLLGRAGSEPVVPPDRSHRPAAGGQALRPRDPGRGRRGPPGQPDPLRLAGPLGHPRPHRSRPDQHRLLPERRPPGQPVRHPGAVRGPQHQPEQARVATDQEGAR